MWVMLCEAGSPDTLGIWSRMAITNQVWDNRKCYWGNLGMGRSGGGRVACH